MTILKRITAGVLSALTMVGSFPTASAAPVIERMDDGVFKFPISRAEADNEASETEIKIGEQYIISDRGSQQATFLQDGSTRNIWPMHSQLSDNTEFAVYCGDHTKGNPGDGMEFTVTERVSDMRLYGVVTKSDARSTLDAFVGAADGIERGATEILSNPEFDDWCYFCASQAAIWAALGDVNIVEGHWDNFSWSSSESLGYRCGAGKALSANGVKSSLTLYAATLMLKQGNMFNEIWGPNGVNHAPWVGGSFSYSKGKTEFDPAAKESGRLDLPKGIADSGVFTLDTIDGQECYVLPMAATSGTFIRAEQIFVALKDAPTGAFLIDSNGVKSTAESRLTLHKAVRNNDLADNLNGQTWGETFKFCIPKSTVEAMTASGETLKASLAASMSVDRYNVYIATPPYDSVQPGILVEPAVQKILIQQEFSSQPTEQYAKLKVLKTDENKVPLAGAKIQIEYTDPKTNKKEIRTKITDANGETEFWELPINTDITVTELEAPPGYEKILEPKTVNSGNGEGDPVTCTIENHKSDPDTVGLKIIKKDADDVTKSLQGAEFKVEYTDAGTPKTLTGTTGTDGSLSFTGLPLGAQVTITETNPPAGYKLMSLNPVTKTLPTTPGETGVVEYTFTDQKNPDAPDIPDVQKLSLRVIKVDNGTSVPLKGFTFELYKGTTLVTSGTTDDNGEIMFTDLEPGDYRVREAGGTEDYAVDAPDQFVTLVKDQSEIPTLTFRNDKKRDYRIKKVDADTGKPIQGVVFKIFRDGQSLGQLPPTDANGEVQLEHTEFGTYNVKEVTVPPEYVKSDETFTMEIDKDSQNPFIFTIPNKHKKKLTLKKIDEETGLPMSGVTFDIYLDNNKIGSKTAKLLLKMHHILYYLHKKLYIYTNYF